ncbi:hypothetical protein [Prochlorococcus sp. MIT 0604]|uniref:hypothetical protein n=1 Tax=Prochlorococcus sp. MIT 0604 TaxID=1501268 RepID=UPI001CED6625|nr:hypothetical protein [Prochlorococcus sp. MIT 0604]
MDLSSVENHLGVMLNPIKNTQKEDLYEVKDFKMSDLPVLSLKLRIKNEEGLKQIAYEIDYENMTEVLAGLRNRFGSPIGTSEIVDGNEPQQQWIWHTGVDVITAIKSDKRPFILSYKPSLLDPSFLG